MIRDTVAYQSLVEALTNALKHGSDGKATVSLEYEDNFLHIRIANCFEKPITRTTIGGHGLVGMAERIALAGGSVASEALQTGFFCVLLEFPLEPANAPAEHDH